MPPGSLATTLAAASLLALAPTGAAASPPPAPSPDAVPGQVIVRYEDGTTAAARARIQRATGTRFRQAVSGGSRRLAIRDGQSVGETVRELRARPGVRYAQANQLVRASFVPNDPGRRLQWNLFGPWGVNASGAYDASRAARAPGGRGAVVAVIDSGVAYSNRGGFREAPDLYARTFVTGRDFVDNDPYANDENGHGTHVAGTIAQATNNRRGVAGLAYGARIMPLRVLDSRGLGESLSIARALRYAAQRRADVANISVELADPAAARDVPELIAAARYAARRGVVIVSSSGNSGDPSVNYPAAAPGVISVGATTIHGCRADYSNDGPGLDLVAPGGGSDAAFSDNPSDLQHCQPGRPGPPIVQQTFLHERAIRRFGYPGDYIGTSFAAPHVSAAAAMVIATRRVGRKPSPALVEQRLKQSARDLGPEGYDTRYGFGLLDAAAALSR